MARRHGERGIEGVMAELRGHPELGPNVLAWHSEAARPGVVAEWPARLAPELVALYRRRGVERPYAHQARAIDAALDGRDVLVSTPTASGKTLAYAAPVLQALLESDGAARALWMFPTKALSQDQSFGLNGLIGELDGGRRGWHSFTYDGDTPPSVRRTLRDRGHVVLTNPWMLHQGILPNHGKWSELFRGLRYVVIDEVHTLSGVFGSSVANVLRRLVRIARHYGSEPRFLLSSATVRDPAEHGRRLLGRDVLVVDEDGSPAGEKHFCVYEPPLVDAVAGLRANALEEARRLAPTLCGPGHQTIFFCNRRTAVEVLTRYLKENAARMGLDESAIRGYRGGYLPNLRREIEAGLKDGSVKVVVSTNALELGIDVGRLDVAVLVGYPGSQAAFRQRSGRVGRRGGASLAVMVARSDPIDQWLARHPEALFGGARERLGLDPDNLVLLSEQLKCAAFELPFHAGDDGSPPPFGGADGVDEILDYFADEGGFLHRREGTWYWTADAYPAQDVTLFGNEPDNVVILDAETGDALGEIDREGSITTCHEGAIYQVEGETWKVERFDHENRRAYAKRVASDYFTDAQTDVEVRVLRLEERRTALVDGREDWAAWRGEVHVTTVATQYKKIRFYTRENVGSEDIQLPPEELDTQTFVLTLDEARASALGLASGDRAAAWRGVGRLLRRTAPLFLRCQPSDLGLSTQVRSAHFGCPAIFVFDRVMGGVGLTAQLVRGIEEVIDAARDVVRDCECEQGCPACVGPVEEVGPRGKATAAAVLEHLARSAALADAPIKAAPIEVEPA